MNPADPSNLRYTLADLVRRRWIAEASFSDLGLRVIWTPEGAKKAMVLSKIVSHYGIRTLADLAHFDRGCKDLRPGMTVGPKVLEFWRTITNELGIEGDLNRLFEVLRMVSTANRHNADS
jgi:hypothetical protein